MDAIQYVQMYKQYLNEIRQVVKPELYYVVDQLMELDPHEQVGPDTWFINDSAARGFVWTLFIKNVKMVNN